MNRHLRVALLVVVSAAAWAASIWGGLWYRSQTAAPADLLQRLPTTGALVVYLDFDALRSAGILRLLENSKVAEEPEYREFTRQIDFDYQKDLDTVLLSVAPTGRYLLVRGRFNWSRLRAYVDAQGGSCPRSFCRIEGSAPERRISFFPLESDLMALAVSPDDSAALRLSTPAAAPAFEVPAAPVWVSIPPSVLQSGENLPAETRGFARTLARADSVALSLVPESGRFAARLAVRCRTQQDAADLAMQLTRLTTLLRGSLASAHQSPNPADLTGVLAAGSFRSDDARVTGSWPIARAFLENLLNSQN